jgi:hypothetical protein
MQVFALLNKLTEAIFLQYILLTMHSYFLRTIIKL